MAYFGLSVSLMLGIVLWKQIPPENSKPYLRAFELFPDRPARFSPQWPKLNFAMVNCSIDASPFGCVSCAMPNAFPVTRRPTVRGLVLLLTDRGDDYTTIAAQAPFGETERAPNEGFVNACFSVPLVFRLSFVPSRPSAFT